MMGASGVELSTPLDHKSGCEISETGPAVKAQPEPPKVLIAGAGIAGLVAGLSLLQRGIEVEVFEQASELQELGAGVQLSANGTRILIALGLEQEMEAIASEPSGKEIRLFSTGRTWKLFDLGASSRAVYGAPYWMVHRGDFHRVLLDAFNARAPAGCISPVAVQDLTTTKMASGFVLRMARLIAVTSWWARTASTPRYAAR